MISMYCHIQVKTVAQIVFACITGFFLILNSVATPLLLLKQIESRVVITKSFIMFPVTHIVVTIFHLLKN